MEIHGGVIVKRCQGCSQVNGGHCRVYRSPVVKWSPGKVCLMASHVNVAEKKKTKILDPGKASKKGSSKREKHD